MCPWPPETKQSLRLNGINTLTAVRAGDEGLCLDGGEGLEVLLPKGREPSDCAPGAKLDVFVYPGKDGSLLATTHIPVAQAGECAFLQVVSATRAGAFLDWGLEDDLLVPVSQQQAPMQPGHSYVVYLYQDPDGRIIGSSKLHRFLDERARDMAPGDEVDLLIVTRTELGFKAIINNTHLGVIYQDEVFQPVKAGDRMRGFIKSIRDDRKIDLSLQYRDHQSRPQLTQRIVEFLQANGGVSSLTDYSDPDAIYRQFGVSKSNYKKALGALYKQRRITLDKKQVKLLT